MRNNIFAILTVLFFVLQTSYMNGQEKENISKDQTYRYIHKIKFKKVKSGENLEYIYCPVPRSSDYQVISNIDTHGGEILDNPGSPDNYIRYTILPEKHPTKDKWGEVILEFDYTPTKTEYTIEKVGKIFEYDTTTFIYKYYTRMYYEFFDTENATIKKISDELWKDATDAYDYAKKCYDYVNENYTFKNNPGMWNSMSDIVKYKGGDCGNLSSIIITLLRCKNIPARHVIAYLHAWGEFYLEGYGWIPVDPTFKTFGKVVDGYGLIRSHEIIYEIEILENNKIETGRIDILSKTHFFYPDHGPYICDLEVTKTPISN